MNTGTAVRHPHLAPTLAAAGALLAATLLVAAPAAAVRPDVGGSGGGGGGGGGSGQHATSGGTFDIAAYVLERRLQIARDRVERPWVYR